MPEVPESEEELRARLLREHPLTPEEKLARFIWDVGHPVEQPKTEDAVLAANAGSP